VNYEYNSFNEKKPMTRFWKLISHIDEKQDEEFARENNFSLLDAHIVLDRRKALFYYFLFWWVLFAIIFLVSITGYVSVDNEALKKLCPYSYPNVIGNYPASFLLINAIISIIFFLLGYLLYWNMFIYLHLKNGKYEGIKNFAFYNGENSKEAVSYISRVDKSAGRRDVNDLMRVYYVLIFAYMIYASSGAITHVTGKCFVSSIRNTDDGAVLKSCLIFILTFSWSYPVGMSLLLTAFDPEYFLPIFGILFKNLKIR
jgi:hypothetical protein